MKVHRNVEKKTGSHRVVIFVKLEANMEVPDLN